MTSKIFDISLYSMILSSVTVCIFSLVYCWRKYNPGYLRSFPVYTLVDAGENLFTLYFFLLLPHQKAFDLIDPVQAIFTLFEMLYFSYFLHKILTRKRSRSIVRYFALGYSAFYGFLIVRANVLKMGGLLAVIESFLLCIGCLLYFRELMLNPVVMDLGKQPAFWMVTGIIFYFAMVIPAIFFSTYFALKSRSDMATTAFSVNNFAQVINSVLYIKGMTCLTKNSS